MARMFINKDSGALVRVDRVDASYAYLTVLATLPSHYAMPRVEYDNTFIHLFRPADTGEINAAAEEAELPANAPDEWRRTAAAAATETAEPEALVEDAEALRLRLGNPS